MEKIIEIFKRVQMIPYKIIPFNKEKINENLKCGDCRYKTYLLKKMLEGIGYKTKIVYVIFDWADLPIPKKITRTLKKSGTIFGHQILSITKYGKEINIDCSWDPDLKNAGFPVTSNWDGKSNTLQVTKGKLEFMDKRGFDKKKPKFVKKEAHKFAELLNQYLEKIRKNN